MTELKIKEISEMSENGQNLTKMVFSDSKKETEIVFKGSGKIKVAVEV